jgi:hypothetical protein
MKKSQDEDCQVRLTWTIVESSNTFDVDVAIRPLALRRPES